MQSITGGTESGKIQVIKFNHLLNIILIILNGTCYWINSNNSIANVGDYVTIKYHTVNGFESRKFLFVSRIEIIKNQEQMSNNNNNCCISALYDFFNIFI